MTWRNHCGKDVVVLWSDTLGNLRFSRHLKPGQEMKLNSQIQSRFEAHFLRKDYARAEDYTLSLPLTSFVVAPDSVWEIKPGGK